MRPLRRTIRQLRYRICGAHLCAEAIISLDNVGPNRNGTHRATSKAANGRGMGVELKRAKKERHLQLTRLIDTSSTLGCLRRKLAAKSNRQLLQLFAKLSWISSWGEYTGNAPSFDEK
ncbi:hypothetical protein CDAR_43481 [Caerostris darwini]|uniref:Uncharacterized protein n=1 Tax=Caerostris darwini TaxID=1538125 RepID=A0AAV4WGK7_9ARAC|nr:hypothetical protein CDAR_43481 [Caerostris darwini]